METIWDFPEAEEGAVVSQIMKEVAVGIFEELGDEIFAPRRFDPSTQTMMAEDIWKILTQTIGHPDPLSLNLSWMDSLEKLNHLKSAINTRGIHPKWVYSNIGHQWKDRQQSWKRAQRKKKYVSRRASSQDKSRATSRNKAGTSSSTPSRLASLDGIDIALTDFQPYLVKLPRFKDLAEGLVDRLLDPSFRIHRQLDYPKWINAFGGRDFLVELMVESIPNEILELQEKSITRQLLDQILESQDPLYDWPPDGAYLLYITAPESSEYWRPYVGQARIRQRRIAQHNKAVDCGRQDQLVYWIATKPGRELNYIRLWDLPEKAKGHNHREELVRNVTELLFSLAFRTLPLDQLKMYMNIGPDDFSARGLNVLSPLLQGIYVTAHDRHKARESLALSGDPEIKQFPTLRVEQLRGTELHTPLSACKRPIASDIQEAFNNAIAPELRGKFPGTTPVEIQQSRDMASTEFIVPFGSPNALIGFILDLDEDIFLDTISPSSTITHEEEKAVLPWLPSSVLKIGFNSSNCLIWPFNGGKALDIRQYKVRPSDPLLYNLNRGVIESSGLRVIILCGKSAEKVAISDLFEKVKIQFPNKVTMDGFLERKSEEILRVYLNPGVSLSAISQKSYHPGRKMCLAIKIAAHLTQTPGIKPHLLRSRLALGEVVLLRCLEDRDGITITEEQIPDICWGWLYDHGFQKEDFEVIRKIGGSILRGILLAMITAPKCPDKFRSLSLPRMIPRGEKKNHKKFATSQMEAMKELHRKVADRGSLESANGGQNTAQHYRDICDQFSSQHSMIKSSMSHITQRATLEEDGDFFTAEEIQEDLQDIELDPFILRSLEADSSTEERSFPIDLPAEKIKKVNPIARMPNEMRGKIPTCWWCGESNYGLTKSGKPTYPSWNETLCELLCSSCAIHTHKEGYLPIPKCQILHLEIRCGICGSRFGCQWEFNSQSKQLVCSPRCQQGKLQNKQDRENLESVTYQKQMPNKLQMSAVIREYFRTKHGFDTTIAAIQARRSK